MLDLCSCAVGVVEWLFWMGFFVTCCSTEVPGQRCGVAVMLLFA